MKRMLWLLVVLLMAVPVKAQLPTQLTIFEGVWPGSQHPASRGLYHFSRGIPIRDSDCVKGAVDGTPTDLQLQDLKGNRIPSQFRITGRWKDGCAEWVLVEGVVTVPVGGSVTVNLVKVAEGAGGNFGGPNMAVDNGMIITVSTGTSQFTDVKGRFDLFHAVTVGTTPIVNGDPNSGLVLTGPAPGQQLPNSVSCPPCTTPYLSSADANSTLTIEVNGPIHVTTMAQGDFVGPNGAVYMHWRVRKNYYLNSDEVDTEIALRNADKNNGSDFNAAYKKYTSLYAQVGSSLTTKKGALAPTSLMNFAFGNHTSTPTTGTLTGTDTAYEYGAYSDSLLWSDWNMPNCNGQEGDKCVDSFIARTPNKPPYVYAQNGYQIIKNGTQIGPSGTSGSVFNLYPQGWGDVSNSVGAGIEIGAFQAAAFWPKSLEFQNGGQEVRIGLRPDQSLYQTGGGIPYKQTFPYYTIFRVVFIFHDKALPSEADAFLDYQHYLLVTAPWQYYNNAVDATDGQPALGYMLPDPAKDEDQLCKDWGLSYCKGAGTLGHYLPDAGDPKTGVNVAVHLVDDRGAPGAGNQHEFNMSQEFDGIQRQLAGRIMLADIAYWANDERGFPRSDFAGGWRGTVTTIAQAKQQLTPWGFPSVVSINGGMRDDWCADSCEHYHTYGYPLYYFLTGDPWALEQLETGVADYEMNTLIAYNNPAASQAPGHNAWGPTRAYGHQLSMYATYADFRSQRGHTDTLQALAGADFGVAYGVFPDLTLSGYGDSLSQSYYNGCSVKTEGLDNYLLGIGCPHGISRVRGLHFGASGSNTMPVTLAQSVTFVRKGGVVTATAKATTNFAVDQMVYVNSAMPTDFNGGPFKVTSTPSGPVFVYSQAGPDETGKNGVAHGPNSRIQETMFSGIFFQGMQAYLNISRRYRGAFWTQQFKVNNQTVTIGDSQGRRLAYAAAEASQQEATVNTGVETSSGVSFYIWMDGRNQGPPCVTGGDCLPKCIVSTCGPIDNWFIWAGVNSIAGGTKDLGGIDWTQGVKFVAQKASNAGIMGADYGGYHWQQMVRAVKEPTPRLIDVPNVVVPNPCTGACKITWTVPSDLTSMDGQSYWLSYELTPVGTTPKTIVNDLGFHRECLAPCGGLTTTNASDGSGSWVFDPAKNINWIALQDVNQPVTGNSFTLQVPSGQVATISLKYYSSTAK